MSLAALKRKTGAKYGNHTNASGFSLNGNTRYPSYIGKGSALSRSGTLQGNVCCAYETNSPEGFNTVKNYRSVYKHGRLTRWYKEDFTQQEWDAALTEAGLKLADYPYPRSGVLQKIKNNWVQSSEHGDGSSNIYTHNKKQATLRSEIECNQNDINKGNPQEKTQCATGGIATDTGTIKHKCVPITKDIGIGKDSATSLERIKHRRGALNPTGYAKPFPYNTSTPGFRACKETEAQAIDALKNGYFAGETIDRCNL